jgi:hypothetical protein
MTSIPVIPFSAASMMRQPDNDNDLPRTAPARKIIRKTRAQLEEAERLILEAGRQCNIRVAFD